MWDNKIEDNSANRCETDASDCEASESEFGTTDAKGKDQ